MTDGYKVSIDLPYIIIGSSHLPLGPFFFLFLISNLFNNNGTQTQHSNYELNSLSLLIDYQASIANFYIIAILPALALLNPSL